MADVYVNALTQISTEPTTTDSLVAVNRNTNEGKIIDYNKLADAILNKLTSKTYSGLNTTSKLLVGAINELDSDVSSLDSRFTSIQSGSVTQITKSGLYYLYNAVTDKPEGLGGVLCISFPTATSGRGLYIEQEEILIIAGTHYVNARNDSTLYTVVVTGTTWSFHKNVIDYYASGDTVSFVGTKVFGRLVNAGNQAYVALQLPKGISANTASVTITSANIFGVNGALTAGDLSNIGSISISKAVGQVIFTIPLASTGIGASVCCAEIGGSITFS